MPEAVIVSALRTPIGTAMKGTLRDTDAYALADHVVSAAAADLDSVPVDDVILGEGLYGGGVVARHAAITAGLATVPGLAQNRHCAAGQAAVNVIAAAKRWARRTIRVRSRRLMAPPSTSAPAPPRRAPRLGGQIKNMSVQSARRDRASSPPCTNFKHRACHFVPAWELFFRPEPMNGC